MLRFLKRNYNINNSKFYILNERLEYQNNVLLEHHHILDSNKLTHYYKEDLKKIYNSAIDNYKNNIHSNEVKLWKNSNLKYQYFELCDYQYIPFIKIFILISDNVQENYLTVSNNEYDDMFNSKILPVYQLSDDGCFKNAVYSVIIELNSTDINEEFYEYNLGTLYHEFTHIIQSVQNYFIKNNSTNASYISDNLLRDVNKQFLDLNKTQLMYNLIKQSQYSLNDLIYILACLTYYCDYSERSAYLQSVQAEIKQLKYNQDAELNGILYNKDDIEFIKNQLNDPKKRINCICKYISNTYKKYFYLNKIIQNILNINISINIKKIINRKLLNDYIFQIDINKNFNDIKGNLKCRTILNKNRNDITFKEFLYVCSIAINNFLKKANKIIADEIIKM